MFKKGDVVKSVGSINPSFLLINARSKSAGYSITCIRGGEGFTWERGHYYDLFFLPLDLWSISSFEELVKFEKGENGSVDMPEPKEGWEDVFPLFIEMTKPDNIDDILGKINEVAKGYDNMHCGLPLYGLKEQDLMRYAFQEWIKCMFIDYKYG